MDWATIPKARFVVSELRFGFLLLVVCGLAILGRGLQQSGGASRPASAKDEIVVESAAEPALTTILPEGYVSSDKADAATPVGTTAKEGAVIKEGVVLPDGEAPIVAGAQPVLPEGTNAAPAGQPAPKETKKADPPDAPPKAGESVTEFVPFVEVDKDEKGASLPIESVAASQTLPVDKPGTVSGGMVRSYDVPKEKVGSATSPSARPVHPYFQRYLDQKRYFVRPGDSLENIALRLYQDPNMAGRIRELNRDKLGPDGKPRPGFTLDLP